jgi:hypothetical protein
MRRPDTDAKKAIRRAEGKARREDLVNTLIGQMRGRNLPEPEREWKFAAPERQWRFDFAWPWLHLALEVDGGTWLPGGGRHNRGAGYRKDIEKMNEAALLGWVVVRCDTDMVADTSAVALVERAIGIQQERHGLTDA